MRALPIVLVLALFLVLPPAIAPSSGAPTFSQTKVDVSLSPVGEPSVYIDPATASKMYIGAPTFGAWGSDDGGLTWTMRHDSQFDTGSNSDIWTNGDTSIAVDLDHTIYLSGLTDGGQLASVVPFQSSSDGGRTWTNFHEFQAGASGISCDRQWTAARGHGEVGEIVRCGSDELFWRSTDHAATWTSAITAVAGDVNEAGPLYYAPDGFLYFLYFNGNSDLRLAKSSDGGLTWSTVAVKPNPGNVGFPVLAADTSGNLYAAYDSASFVGIPTKSDVWLTTSKDHGATWSASKRVSDGSRTALFPWVVAGAPGKVDIAYYTRQSVIAVNSPDIGEEGAWDVEMRQNIDVFNSSTFQKIVVAPNFHTGSICTSGIECVGPQVILGFPNVPTPFDRRVLDFFEMRVDPSGNAFIVYPKDHVATSTTDTVLTTFFVETDLMLARQTGGTTIN